LKRFPQAGSRDKDVGLPLLRPYQPPAPSTPSPSELDRILRMQVPVIVKLADRKLTLQK